MGFVCVMDRTVGRTTQRLLLRGDACVVSALVCRAAGTTHPNLTYPGAVARPYLSFGLEDVAAEHVALAVAGDVAEDLQVLGVVRHVEDPGDTAAGQHWLPSAAARCRRRTVFVVVFFFVIGYL